MAKFNTFTEKQVREAILKKGSLSNINKIESCSQTTT